MGIKRRMLLPLIQVVVAAVLTITNRMRPFSAKSPTWTAPDKQFCDAVNAPAALVRFLMVRVAEILFPQYYLVEVLLETVVFVALVGLLWYAATIEWGGHGESVVTPRTRLRKTTDGAIMLFGVLLAILGLVVRGQFGAVTTYSNIVAMPYYLWAIAIISFYGHDMWASSKHNAKLMTGSRPS